MKLWYEQDDEDQYTLKMEVAIKSKNDIIFWAAEMTRVSNALFESRGHKKWFCLLDIAHFSLEPSLANDYGARAKKFVEKYFSGAIRYGSPDGLCTQSALRLGAMKNNSPSNIMRDREAALTLARGLRAA